MVKGGGGKSTTNLLRLSGLIFAVVGTLHVLRYFLKVELKIGGFELTYLGSLIIGGLLLLLSAACFMNAKK